MQKQNIHAMLLTLVGGYMLFIAWNLLDKLRAGSGDMPRWAFILFIAVFGLAGLAVLVYAYLVWKKAEKKEDENEDQESDGRNDREDGGAMK